MIRETYVSRIAYESLYFFMIRFPGYVKRWSYRKI